MTVEFQPQDPQRFQAALERFDLENAADPNRIEVAGQPQPRELVYARWLTDWVLRLAPQASEALRLAARCQHLGRWKVPRDSCPMTRAGYLRWREGLKQFHAQRAGEILRQIGYAPDLIARVQDLNLKKHFPQDPEAQVLEDALCLVFLERQLDELARKTSDEKIVNALQKSWNKMSAQARELAGTLAYNPRQKMLLEKALA
jgi:hypothetical protein